MQLLNAAKHTSQPQFDGDCPVGTIPGNDFAFLLPLNPLPTVLVPPAGWESFKIA